MKVQDLQEARLAPTNQNDVVAKWLKNGLGSEGPHKRFLNIALDIDVGGGLQNAVRMVQEWNVLARFIHEHTGKHAIMEVSPRELNK